MFYEGLKMAKTVKKRDTFEDGFFLQKFLQVKKNFFFENFHICVLEAKGVWFHHTSLICPKFGFFGGEIRDFRVILPHLAQFSVKST